MRLLIKNGRVVDPSYGTDKKLDILIEKGKIIGIKSKMSASGAKSVDASGQVVAPGFIDMHVHLREPGYEDTFPKDTGAGNRMLYVRDDGNRREPDIGAICLSR